VRSEGLQGVGGSPCGGTRVGPGLPVRVRTQTGRFSARRKREAVRRLIRGEDLELLSRELGVTAATLRAWRETFERAGEAALKSRQPDARDEELMQWKAKIGELTMANELLEAKIEKLEQTRPFAWRKSKP
jgi:transposase-like protein